MYMTAIKEVNRLIIYIMIRHCYFVEYVELLPITTTQGVNIIFSEKLTRRVVKVWAPEMIATYILCHNLGAQPCKSTTGNWQEANNDGHYRKTLIANI